MSVTIRAIRDVDKAEWLRLFRDYIIFYSATVPDDVIEVTWQRLVTGADNMAGLIALDDIGVPVGIANLVFHRSTWSPTWYCYLEDLFVDPRVRGQGVGRALIEATYAEAERRGATRTYWATQNDNAAARKLYDSVGELTEFVQYRRSES